MKSKPRAFLFLLSIIPVITCLFIHNSVSAEDAPVTFLPGSWPLYVQGGISVEPYPLVASCLTEFCAEVINTDGSSAHTVSIKFYVGKLGIGMSFTPIGCVVEVSVGPGETKKGCMTCFPTDSGPHSVQVQLIMDSYDDQVRERNLNIDETLKQGVPSFRNFYVRNPTAGTATVTLGLIPHFPDWGLELSQDVFHNMPPGTEQTATLTITPPSDMPTSNVPITDAEGYIGGEIIGGFREVFGVPVLQGKVFLGKVGDESAPVSGVCVDLYCSNKSNVLGTNIDNTFTDLNGWYGFWVYYICDYYNIVESDPLQHRSAGASSVDGAVVNKNWIQYACPLKEKTTTGNKFWDLFGPGAMPWLSLLLISN